MEAPKRFQWQLALSKHPVDSHDVLLFLPVSLARGDREGGGAEEIHIPQEEEKVPQEMHIPQEEEEEKEERKFTFLRN